jgi:hypothetical protein
MQLPRARSMYELGRRAEARTVAREAHDVLAHTPGDAAAAKDAAALVARLR